MPPDDRFDVPVERLSREQRRSRRKRTVRAQTTNLQRMPKWELELGRLLYPDEPHWRPKTRGDCDQVQRPCPFVSCRFHLYLDTTRAGNVKLNFPDLEPDELRESCCLDVADRGGETLEEVGALLNITRERLRQVEVMALERLVDPGRRLIDPKEIRTPVRAHSMPRSVERDDADDEELEAEAQHELPEDVERFIEGDPE